MDTVMDIKNIHLYFFFNPGNTITEIDNKKVKQIFLSIRPSKLLKYCL